MAASAVSITGQVDNDLLIHRVGGARAATHAMVPVFIPLLLPLTVIALPFADLALAFIRRIWNGQSPFSADKGHLHHRMLRIGHSHGRAVLVLYFWSAVFAFGTVAYSVGKASVWIVFGIAFLCATGLVLLLLPRLSPSLPRWADNFVPPRFRSTPVSTEESEKANLDSRRMAGRHH
jgi:UDP-GlcNAc:undecaprenyl-phosphate GlcNAc-1-phosphate transferase